ncbi:MAG: ADOP family duplicated permease [Vicinamibacterales bacterium]
MTPRDPGPRVRGERLFGVLLRLYPSSFRARYGQELVESFRRDRVRPRFRGPAGVVRFWRHVVGDLVRTSIDARRPDDGHAAAGHAGPGGGGTGLRFRLAEAAIGLRQAARGLRRQPGFTGVAVLTLALGIGAVTTVFAIVDRVLLAPLPYPEADRLVRVYERERDNPGARMVAYGNYDALRTHTEVFDHLAIWAFDTQVLTGAGDARAIRTRGTSASFAATLGVAPDRGRWFTPEEETDGAAVIVLAHGTATDVFGGGNPVGRTVRLDGEPYDVVGVMPPGFDFPSLADGWYPLPPVRDASGRFRWHRHNMVGRLAEGVTPAAARERLDAIAAGLEREHPDDNHDNFFEPRLLADDATASRRPALVAMTAAVWTLLLVAAANLASLLFARSLREARTSAVRAALGASRGRLAWAVVAESIVIAAAGGLLGLGLSIPGVSAFVAAAGVWMPAGLDVVPLTTTRVAFALGAALACGLVAAVLPAWRAARRAPASTDLPSVRLSAGRGAARARRVLVTAQLTLAFVLTACAGLLARSVDALQHVDTGVVADHVLTMDLQLPAASYPDGPATARALNALVERLEALPGVERAGATLTGPVDDSGWMNGFTIRDRPVPTPDIPPVSYVVTTSGYLDALQVPIERGRMFDADEPRGEFVAVINRAAAERFFPGEDPIGRQILGSSNGRVPWATVIGVSGNIRQSLRSAPQPEVYLPIAQDRVLEYVLVVRTAGEPLAAAAMTRAAIRDFDADVPVDRVMTLAERIGDTEAQPRLTAVLVSVLAVLALGLSAAGVFGVVSYSVAERRREFGIRLAIGRPAGQILAQVLSETVALAVVATGIGACWRASPAAPRVAALRGHRGRSVGAVRRGGAAVRRDDASPRLPAGPPRPRIARRAASPEEPADAGARAVTSPHRTGRSSWAAPATPRTGSVRGRSPSRIAGGSAGRPGQLRPPASLLNATSICRAPW